MTLSRRRFLANTGKALLYGLVSLVTPSKVQAQDENIVLEEAIRSFAELISDEDSLIGHTRHTSSEELIQANFPFRYNKEEYKVEASIQYKNKDVNEGELVVSINGSKFSSNLDGSNYEGSLKMHQYASILRKITRSKKAQRLANLVFADPTIKKHEDVSNFLRTPHTYPGSKLEGRTDKFHADKLFWYVHVDVMEQKKPSYSPKDKMAIGISKYKHPGIPIQGRDATIGDRNIDGSTELMQLPPTISEKLFGKNKAPASQAYEIVLDKLIAWYSKS